MQLPDFKKVPVFGFWIKWLQSHNMDYGLHVTTLSFIFLYIAFSTSPTLMGSTFSFFFGLAPIWLPIMIFLIFFIRWMDFVGKVFWFDQGRTLFRINLPQEITRSPQAMEFVFNAVWNKQTPDNLWQTYIDGKRPVPVSYEIASIGGDIRFYVNMNTKKAKEAFTASMYSQYPGVEIIEEPVDYTSEIQVGDPDWDLFSTHYGKKEAKWGPIKTYIDYGHDKIPDEEEKDDPMTPILELMGSIGPHERMYLQFVTAAFRSSSFATGQLMFGEGPSWTKAAQERVDELMMRDPTTKAPLNTGETDFEGAPRVTPGERGDIESIERNMTKYGYSVGIRMIYAAKKGHFNGNILNPTNRMFSQFDQIGRGSFTVPWRTDFDYMWFSDPFGDRLRAVKQQEHRELKVRRFYQKSQSDFERIYTTEELATMFHLPGKVAVTPTLGRIPSARSQAPSNLPVGELPDV